MLTGWVRRVHFPIASKVQVHRHLGCLPDLCRGGGFNAFFCRLHYSLGPRCIGTWAFSPGSCWGASSVHSFFSPCPRVQAHRRLGFPPWLMLTGWVRRVRFSIASKVQVHRHLGCLPDLCRGGRFNAFFCRLHYPLGPRCIGTWAFSPGSCWGASSVHSFFAMSRGPGTQAPGLSSLTHIGEVGLRHFSWQVSSTTRGPGV